MATSSLTEAHQKQYGHIILNLPADRKAFPHVVSPLGLMTFRTLPPLKYNSYTCKASLSCCTNTRCQMHTPTTPFKRFMKTGHTIPLVGISREIKAYIAKDSYRSWVLQFSASLALNLIISRHLLLQMKLSISSSVEGKKKKKNKPANKKNP